MNTSVEPLGPSGWICRSRRHSGQAQGEPESKVDSRPGLLSAGVTFFRGNDEPTASQPVLRSEFSETHRVLPGSIPSEGQENAQRR
jgi:hypothetical protein